MSTADTVRPRYREGQRLTVADLAAEQDGRRAARERHAISAHGWGIAGGLDLSTAAGRLSVSAGHAVDGFGRPLVLPAAAAVSLADLPAPGPDGLDVWLLYGERADRARVAEGVRLHAAAADGALPTDPAPGPGGPELTGAASWPVYLGRVGAAVSAAGRRYTGLVGDTVLGPVRFVPAPDQPGGRTPGPAIQLDLGPQAHIALTATAGATELFRIGDGTEPSHVDGGVAVTGEVRAAVLRAPAVAAVPGRPGRLGAAGPADGALRLEIPRSSTPGTDDGFSVVAPDARLLPALTVRSDGHAIVRDLTVGDRLLQGPVHADPDDPRFAAALTTGWLDGLSRAADAAQERFALTDTVPPALRLDITRAAVTVADGQPRVELRARLTNTGQQLVSFARLVANVAGGTGPASLGSAQDLDRNHSFTAFLTTISMTALPGQQVAITVTALGLRTDDAVVWASASTQVTVPAPPPEAEEDAG
jgi:hypothetical protein